MDTTTKCKSNQSTTPNKLAKQIQKVINLKASKRTTSGVDICMLNMANPHHIFIENQDFNHNINNATTAFKTHNMNEKKKRKSDDGSRKNRKAALEALLAKLFAGVTTIKASYAEMQVAQSPYNADAIQVADHACVEELKRLSELKRSYHKNNLDHVSSVHVSLLLAEIQEQQSIMKTYEITMKKLENERETKANDVMYLRKRLDESVKANKGIEKKLNESSSVSILDHVQFSDLKTGHFVQFLHYTSCSVKNFVRVLVKEMEKAKWNIGLASKVIEPEANLAKPSDICFIFESFVCKAMFEHGFDHPSTAFQTRSLQPESEQCFNQFKKFNGANPKRILNQEQNSAFSTFVKAKYLQVVHAKMGCSFTGNLNQRKLMNSGQVPDSKFFTAFLEMARRVWCLNLLAFSFNEDVSVFQVKKNCRLSEVYMQSVNQELVLESGRDGCRVAGLLRSGFTVVPGFKIGKNVIQCQVYCQ